VEIPKWNLQYPDELKHQQGLSIEFQNWGGLNKNTYYPEPRLGMPDDIRANYAAASEISDNHTAYFMSQAGAFKPIGYKGAVYEWDRDDYPTVFFHKYPFLVLPGN